MKNHKIMLESKTNKALIRRIKQHIIAQKHLFFAIVQPGFEETSKKELQTIGIEEFGEIIEGGIEFYSKLDGCYKVNICSRTITRLLMRLISFKVERFDILEKKVEKFPWELYISDTMTLSFSIHASHSKLYHTGKIAEIFTSGISSRLSIYGIKVNFSAKSSSITDQIIFIRIKDNVCQISIDTSGGFLYKRGHKSLITKATIRETIAALILLEARLLDYDILIDPMCGSGSFTLEAIEIFANQYPGINREFSFFRWPSFKLSAYNYLKKNLYENVKPTVDSSKKIIYVSDIDPEAVSLAKKNIESVGLSENVNIGTKDFFNDIIDIPENKKCLIVLNPPYGNRIKKTNLEKQFRQIGNTIRQYYSTCGYAIISPALEYEKIMSLSYDRKILFMNGGIKVAVIIRDNYN